MEQFLLSIFAGTALTNPIPSDNINHRQHVTKHISQGKASYYTCYNKTANGEKFNPNGLTAAHRTLPFGTVVKVTNLHNGRSVHVRINDRGPFIKDRIIDLSKGAAHKIGMVSSGSAKVSISKIN